MQTLPFPLGSTPNEVICSLCSSIAAVTLHCVKGKERRDHGPPIKQRDVSQRGYRGNQINLRPYFLNLRNRHTVLLVPQQTIYRGPLSDCNAPRQPTTYEYNSGISEPVVRYQTHPPVSSVCSLTTLNWTGSPCPFIHDLLRGSKSSYAAQRNHTQNSACASMQR